MSGPGRGYRPPGSECCVVGGDDHGEAYTAIVQGGRLIRESSNIAEAEAFSVAEGNMCGTVMRGADALPRSKTPSRTKGSRRNLGDPTFGQRRQTTAKNTDWRSGLHFQAAARRPVWRKTKSPDAAGLFSSNCVGGDRQSLTASLTASLKPPTAF